MNCWIGWMQQCIANSDTVVTEDEADMMMKQQSK